MLDFQMDTRGEKDLFLLWEWAQEYLGRSGQAVEYLQGRSWVVRGYNIM